MFQRRENVWANRRSMVPFSEPDAMFSFLALAMSTLEILLSGGPPGVYRYYYAGSAGQ
jgi:hypothetical protein